MRVGLAGAVSLRVTRPEARCMSPRPNHPPNAPPPPLQNEDGGYGLHIEGHSTMFGTVLSYLTLRILGISADDEGVAAARAWIRGRGGAKWVTSWGKFWLAVLGKSIVGGRVGSRWGCGRACGSLACRAARPPTPPTLPPPSLPPQAATPGPA